MRGICEIGAEDSLNIRFAPNTLKIHFLVRKMSHQHYLIFGEHGSSCISVGE